MTGEQMPITNLAEAEDRLSLALETHSTTVQYWRGYRDALQAVEDAGYVPSSEVTITITREGPLPWFLLSVAFAVLVLAIFMAVRA